MLRVRLIGSKVPALGIAIAFIKDPWGTNIEMTEGLDAVQ